MMLLTNTKESKDGFAERIICRYIRDIAFVLFGILMISGITLVISKFETGSRGRVYAVNSALNEGGQRIQTGLTGVMEGVADMERYAKVTRLVNVGGAKEDALAGAAAVDRRALWRAQIGSGTDKASELGYYAQQAVLENQMSSEEYYTLLQIVEAEATGGDVISKMMVAGVVLNRVRDSHFPDTICDVVWQDDQFQPTSDGRIYSCSVTDSTVEAVERVLQGEDYSEGALFFLARDGARTQDADWFDAKLAKLFEYGGHEYYTYQEYVNG